MKNKYTKKQIIEAIAYWQKQLDLGNYRKINEGSETKYVFPKNGAFYTIADMRALSNIAQNCNQDKDIVCVLVDETFICGIVNSIEQVDNQCVLTLAPYISGSRKKDVSIKSGNPIPFDALLRKMESMSDSTKIVVKMRDPYGMGPNVNRVISVPIESGKVTYDGYNGVFLHVSM